jgi:twinkle protein
MPQTEPLTETAISALEARGIDQELADRYGVLSIVPGKRSSKAAPQTWVMFPHTISGTQVHWAARTLDGEKRFHQQPGGQRCLWNHDAIADTSLMRQTPLLVTEGHLDALSLMTVGFRAVVSVPDGAPGGKQTKPSDDEPGAKAKYSYLAAIRDQLRAWPSVILATDADLAGDRLADDLARIIGVSRCRRMEYPPGCKDANDVLVNQGADELMQCVEASKWIRVGGLYDLDTLPTLDLKPAAKSGISGIDDLWRFRPGELSVLCGTPNHGKSSLANHMGLSLAMTHGWVVAWFSPEQHPSIHVNRLISCYLAKPARIATEDELTAARKFIRNHVIWISPDRDDEPTVSWLKEHIAIVAWRYNCRMVIIDPWNQLIHDRGREFREDEYEREQLKDLGKLAVDAALHVMVLVHPRKPQTDNKSGKTPIPNGYSISGSAHWINRPDLGGTIWRDGEEVLFRCWKARYSDGEDYDNGQVGDRDMRLNRYTMRYYANDLRSA